MVTIPPDVKDRIRKAFPKFDQPTIEQLEDFILALVEETTNMNIEELATEMVDKLKEELPGMSSTVNMNEQQFESLKKYARDYIDYVKQEADKEINQMKKNAGIKTGL